MNTAIANQFGGGLRPPSDGRRAAGAALLAASPRGQDGAGKAGARTRFRGGSEALPSDYLVGLEDALQECLPGEVGGNAGDADALGQLEVAGAREHHHTDLVSGGALLVDDGVREGVGALHQVQHPGHQKTTTRRPGRSSSAIRARETGTIGWPLSFQSGSDGTASSSTWNGTPSRLRLSRNLAISSPSTRSSVSASSRWTAGPRSTNVTSFSPATTPTP